MTGQGLEQAACGQFDDVLQPVDLFRRDILTGRPAVVISLHGQGVDRLGEGLVVEATSPDGVIEGLRYNDDTQFIVGVQWHAEWQPDKHVLSSALYTAFGEAARARVARRMAGLAAA